MSHVNTLKLQSEFMAPLEKKKYYFVYVVGLSSNSYILDH